MTLRAGAAAFAVAVSCGLAFGAAVAPPSVRLVGALPTLEAGRPWTVVVRVRGGRPRLRARLGRRLLTLPTSRVGTGRYRARLRLPSPGTWVLSASVAKRRFALARVRVVPASYALANPGQLLVLPGGDVLLAERGNRNQLLRVDPASGRFRVFARGIPAPFGFALAGDRSILVSSEAGILRIPEGGQARKAYDISAGPIALAPNGDLYYGNQLELGRIDATSDQVERLPVGVSVPHGLALTGSGELIVSDSGNQRILRVITATGQATVVASNLRDPLGLALDGSGRTLVVEYSSGRLTRIDEAGARTTIASGLRKPYALALAPGGGAYVVEAGELNRPSGRLRLVDPEGTLRTIRLRPDR